MADITMCTNKDCTLRGSCERATAYYGQWQWVQEFKQDENGKCEMYRYAPGSDYEPPAVEW